MNLKDTEILSKNLFNQYGLNDWYFEFDTSIRRFGYCNYRTKTISLSKQLTKLNDISQVKNIILHEIAHALLKPGHGHDKVWINTAKSIGCNGSRLYDSNEVKTPNKKYIGRCSNCNIIIKRHRQNKIACSTCCKKFNNGKYSTKYLFIWRLK